jgi:hypothetical protein
MGFTYRPNLQEGFIMVELVLDRAERNAIDWIGYRYRHGDQLRDFLEEYMKPSPEQLKQWDDEDCFPWDSRGELRFEIPNMDLLEMSEILIKDNMACFSGELKEKLLQCTEQLV